MKIKQLVMLFLTLVLTAVLTASCGGGDSTLKASTTTMGQELSDLKKAYSEGIITEKEYEKSKQNILDRYE